MRRALAAVALLVLVTLPMLGAPAEQWADFYDKGLTAAERNDWAAARDLMQKAIAAKPGEQRSATYKNRTYVYVPHFWLGIALYQQGDIDGALREFSTSESQGVIQSTQYHAQLNSWKARAQEEKVNRAQQAAYDVRKKAGAAIQEATLRRADAMISGAERTEDFQKGKRLLEEAVRMYAPGGDRSGQLGEALGVSRTPIREAMTLLEPQEGFLRTVPRRGVFIVRKTKKQICEMIEMWAALESMAARLATVNASDADIAALRPLFDEFRNSAPAAHLADYSDANIAFHQTIIRLSGSHLMGKTIENLFIHVRAIRRMTISQGDRAARSILDLMRIIEALERRDTELAERLVRQHSLDLAAHVEQYCDFLD